MRFFSLVVIGLLAACSGPRLPPPNSVNAQYDARQRAVQVMVSGLQPPTDATLVANDGARYAASGIVLISGPHVLYNPPPPSAWVSAVSDSRDAVVGSVRVSAWDCLSADPALPKSAINMLPRRRFLCPRTMWPIGAAITWRFQSADKQ